MFCFSTLLTGCVASSEGSGHEGPLAASFAPSPKAAITTGKMQRWPEATQYLRFDVSDAAVRADLGAARASGLDAFWSVASTNPGSGFFYADSIRGTRESKVAYAAGVTSVREIRDASLLDFRSESVGPVPVGGIVVIEHAPTHRYLALVLDAMEPTDPRTAGAGPYAYADVTWYLTPPYETDFGAAYGPDDERR